MATSHGSDFDLQMAVCVISLWTAFLGNHLLPYVPLGPRFKVNSVYLLACIVYLLTGAARTHCRGRVYNAAVGLLSKPAGDLPKAISECLLEVSY